MSSEEPALFIRLGYSRNPLGWVFLAARVGLFVFMGALVVLLGQQNPLPAFVAGPVVLFLFLRYVVRELAIDKSSYRFFDDRLEMDLRVPPAPREQRVVAYEALGHLELTSMSMIKMSFAPKNEPPFRVEIPVHASAGEDVFDEMVDHVQRAAPEHLFSIYENGIVRYSRDCTLESLFPRDAGQVEIVGVNDSVISAGDREYRLADTTVFTRNGTGEQQLFRVGKAHVLVPNGMVIGTLTLKAYREIVLELFDEDVFHIDGIGWAVRLNDVPVGWFGEKDGEIALRLTRPLPAVIATIVLVAFVTGRKLLRV